MHLTDAILPDLKYSEMLHHPHRNPAIISVVIAMSEFLFSEINSLTILFRVYFLFMKVYDYHSLWGIWRWWQLGKIMRCFYGAFINIR